MFVLRLWSFDWMIKPVCAGFFAGVCLPGFGIMFVCFWDYVCLFLGLLLYDQKVYLGVIFIAKNTPFLCF